MNTIAGILCVRNGTILDYCWQESGRALLEFCDQLILSDCDSTDDTRQLMEEWAAREPRIKICNFPWTDPKGTSEWWPTWINFAKDHATTDFVVACDADEVLTEASYQIIRDAVQAGKALKCRRLNFWRDAASLIPEGFCCGSEVIRVGPQRMFIPSDYPDPRAVEICAIAEPSEACFMHYGFLRRKEAFFRKAKVVQGIWANSYDPRLAAAEKYEGVWSEMPGVTGWENKLVPFYGKHPKLAESWLIERGYDINTMSPEQLVKKWQRVLDEAKHIFTWSEPETLAYCAEKASHATHALEIGVYFGASAFVMLRANPSIHLWCTDHFAVAGTHHLCTNITLKQFIDGGRCELITGNSETAGNMLQHMAGKLDYVFSDNGHAEEDLQRDIRCCLPLVKPGGEMFGHDFDVPHNDVARGVLSMLPESKIMLPVPRVWSFAKP